MAVPDQAGGPRGSWPAGSAGSAGFGIPAGISPRLVRSARFWLRAYPRRWRTARGEEVLGLLADLAGPGDGRLDARSAVNLVRGGWATRWREHPPLGPWLLYRVFDRRIPREYRGWAHDEIDGFWRPLRTFLTGVSFLPIIVMIPGLRDSAGFVLGVLAVSSVRELLFWPNRQRRLARRKHLALRPGEPLVPGAFVNREVPRQRVDARSGSLWTARFLTVVAVASAVAAVVGAKAVYAIPDPVHRASWEIVVAPIGWHRGFAVGVLVVAVLFGVVGAVVGDWNLRRFVPRHLPQQPHRMLRLVSTRGKVGLAVLSALVIGLAWLEASGRLVVGTSVVLGAVALVLLPGAVVAARRTREVAPAFAGHDLWRVMVGGRAPLVDYPAQGVAQLDGPIPLGAVVPPHRLGDPPYPALLI